MNELCPELGLLAAVVVRCPFALRWNAWQLCCCCHSLLLLSTSGRAAVHLPSNVFTWVCCPPITVIGCFQVTVAGLGDTEKDITSQVDKA